MKGCFYSHEDDGIALFRSGRSPSSWEEYWEKKWHDSWNKDIPTIRACMSCLIIELMWTLYLQKRRMTK